MNGKDHQSLYREDLEHDSCGIGFIADLKNRKTHGLVRDALTMLTNMEHRGGCGCEPETGDGAGIMIQTPDEFLRSECENLGFTLPEFGSYGVGMMFLNNRYDVTRATIELVKECAEETGLRIIGFRDVPTNNTRIGQTALDTEPEIKQVFVVPVDPGTRGMDLERRLYVFRKYSTHTVGSSKRGRAIQGNDYEFYWLSLSYKTLIYKGLLRTEQLSGYYLDLNDERLASAIAIIHSRFSTNTMPKWKLGQPFRYLAHNGEINTIRGNVNWMRSKQAQFVSKYFSSEDFGRLLPICDKSHSDSANLDSMIEMLVLGGRSLPHAMLMAIPEAWQHDNLMPEDRKAFYRYHSHLMEPWDGPASISFTDGEVVGAMLDRNGLRPSRYCITSDDRVIMASEAGVLPIDQSTIIKKGRLQPGKIFVADVVRGIVRSDDEIKEELAEKHPYSEWLSASEIRLDELPAAPSTGENLKDEEVLHRAAAAAGFTREDISRIVLPMAAEGKEPIGSMGNDTPLAVMSEKDRHLSSYFKQLFAQVSNPPIDPIRERLIMSLYSGLGINHNVLQDGPQHCEKVVLKSPVLSTDDFQRLRNLPGAEKRIRTLNASFSVNSPAGALEQNLDRLQEEALQFVSQGADILIISDECDLQKRTPIPSLLATGAVHQYLIQNKIRSKTSLVVQCSDIWETHQYAALIGFGANAVNPWLTLELIQRLKTKESPIITGVDNPIGNYIKGIEGGLLKVMSKMGISTIQSYHGAQIFEIVGLDSSIVEKCFKRAISRIEGAKFSDLETRARQRHAASLTSTRLKDDGIYQWKNDGEHHIFDPLAIHLLQKSVRTDDYETFKKYSEHINSKGEINGTIRSLLEMKIQPGRSPIPIEEVEPVENIRKRFATGAMSFGSISYEAHSTLAIAMNRIGAKSNSGEGGEDESRFVIKPNGDFERSAIKQVASGRFGVNSHYLANADEIQIKMAQGAKPGEGGQLPGHKVDDWIARVRSSTPGVGLISPPPHHDIYSIEDLAQLIFDLKNANPKARVNVKLVAEAGVGTIAAGVAKAKADVVLIAGHDGGTGASPLSSIMHAGLPWELGLSEAHQTLLKNKLRSRIVLQADGQMKTGRDLVVAALLGAEEWGVASAALVAEGCIMMRKCHLNTCPVGIATQNKTLRERFTGKPEHIISFFTFLATEMREYMAELGFRSVDEMVGQTESLKILDKAQTKYNLDLSPIIQNQTPALDSLFNTRPQDHEIHQVLDRKLIEKAYRYFENLDPYVREEFPIHNTDRAVGAMLSYEVSKHYGSKGLPDDTLAFSFKGSGGQSFGAFLARGVSFILEGESNDYTGKGMSGGKIVIRPPGEVTFVPSENIIIGNVSFYGATAGKAFINGSAGERFAVRNSGATLVVEGVGDHGCEYMTGGRVIILGDIGRNFGAGMSGGTAFIYSPAGSIQQSGLFNQEMIELENPDDHDLDEIRELIQEHYDLTQSSVAGALLSQWVHESANFTKVIPTEYKRVLKERQILPQAV